MHARVADTNAILDQLVASVRKPKAIALMTTIRDGGLRLHVATPLLEEIPEKILADRDMHRRYMRFGITKDAVLERWRDQVLPRVRVVDVGEFDRAELAAVPDEDDLATAQLAAVLGPGSTWSSDPDLTDPGLAEPYVLELVVAIREVCVIDVQVATASQNLMLVTNLGTELVRAVGRLDPRGRYIVAGLALATLIGVSIAMSKKPEVRQGVQDALQRIADAIMHEITEAYALRGAWADRVPPALALDTPRAERAIARVLATAPAPLTGEEISEVLTARGSEVDSSAIREMWVRFESLLVVLLRELEARFAENVPRIRELALRAQPGEQAVKDLNKLPNTLVLRTEFYEIATLGWLERLDEGGFFDEVARPVVDVGTGQTYLQPTPAIACLARMLPVPEHSDRVLTIVERIAIPHEFAERDLLKAAQVLDRSPRRRYARHLVQFIRSQRGLFLLGGDATDFAVALANAGDTAEAASLLEELLVLRPDPRAATAEGEGAEWFRPKPLGRLDEHDFERVVERGVPTLTKADPMLAFRVLLPLVAKALESSERPGLVAEKADLSGLWMPDLSKAPERYGRIQGALLVKALRAAAVAAVGADPTRFDEVVDALDASEWTVCRRVALDVLDRTGDVVRIRARLLDPQCFARDRHLREFDALAAHHLGALPERDCHEFVELIEAQTLRDHYPGGEPIEPEHSARLLQEWKDDLLRKIAEHLPPDLQSRHAERLTVAERAGATAPQPAPVQPLDARQLAAMSTDDLVAHLKNWKPSESVFQGPTLDTQAGAFREAVLADPARFTAAATSFKDVDPTYVRTIFAVVRELVDKANIDAVAWDPILELALSAVAHKVDSNEGMGFGRDPGWGWTRKEIADILRVALALRPRRIPYDKRDRIRQLIQILVEDERAPAMSDVQERRDALSASINTTRGSALHAALEYVAWAADEAGASGEGRAMERVPEIRELLERHVAIANDPSVAARGAFGYYLNVLLWYDETWVLAHRDDLFPPDSRVATELTWQAFVVWHHVPPRRALEVLADQYRAAIERISPDEAGRTERVDVDEALAQQFAHALIRGWISMDSPDGLLPAFFAKAPARIRAHVLEFLGRIIEASPGDQLLPEHCERVRALWERRRAAAAEFELSDRRRELKAFGWIFVTGRCDQDWMLRELLSALEQAGSIEPDSKVMDKLATLAPSSPVEAVRAVDLLTESPKERWFVQGALEEIQTILRTGLADLRSREAARRVVNRLYADGQGASIVQLLDEPSART